MRAPVAFLAACVVLCASVAPLSAQQASQWIHNQTLGDSFFEGMNVGFGFNLRGGPGIVGLQPNGQFTPNGDIQFRQGNDPGNPLGLGGNNPATLGFSINGKNADLFFGLSMEQGSSRSMSSTGAGVTVMNGGTGTISNTSQRPFVTGIVPVVGEFNHLPVFPGAVGGGFSPVAERVARLNAGGGGGRVPAAPAAENAAPAGGGRASGESSTATRGDLSVAEIRAQQEAEKGAQASEVAALEERALAAAEAGKPGVARVYYRMAADRALGAERTRLLEKLAELDSGGLSPR